MELRAEVIAIGDEITSGVRLDTNTQWISQRLGEIGIQVAFHSTVGDDLQDNIDVFRIASERADIIVCTGGLGPTADDLTRHAIGQMAGVELVLNQSVLGHIESMYSRRGREMPVNNEIQAWFPVGTTVVNNPEGTAPGIDFSGLCSNSTNYRIFALPGVPVEMKQMWEQTVEGELKKLVGDEFVIHHHTVHCFGSGESHIETLLPRLVQRGRDPSVGITASSATISLRVSTRGSTIEACQEKMKPTIATIYNCLGDLVFGENGVQLEEVCVDLLKSKLYSISIMDYGQGGEATEKLSSVSGSAPLIKFAAYEPEVDIISSPTEIEAMACSLAEKNGSSIGLVVSPINREEAAIADGTSIYHVGIGTENKAISKEFRFGGHSAWREIRAVKEVLNCLRLYLKNDS